jgi:hypothetical protein
MEFKSIETGNVSLKEFREQNLAFADKTRYIKELEEHAGTKTPVFLRPRRFGKTLFTDILFSYYDKSQAAQFDDNFKGTWIYDHRTASANSYYCLNLDFSSVSRDSSLLKTDFIQALINGFTDFTVSYPELGLPPEALRADLYASPARALQSFINNFKLHAKPHDRLYFIIDEYDHFINEVLTSDREAFRDLTSNDANHSGLVKNFYACIKWAVGNSPANPIEKVFMTGVSAISLDSVTSGFNIGTNISANARFNAMAGFTHDELSKIIDETVDFSRLSGITKAQVMEIMEQRYDGYLFSAETAEKIFCPNMCLTFLHSLIKTRKIPKALTDSSSGMDAGKLGGMLSLAVPEIREKLEQAIFVKDSVTAEMPKDLNLNESDLFGQEQASSVLTYLGFLTIDPADTEKYGVLRWRCPNEVCYQTFIECEAKAMGFKRALGLDLTGVSERGDLKPLIAEAGRRIAGLPASAFSGFNERCLQIIFYYTANDGNDNALDPELECDTGERGRADLFIRNRRQGGRQYLLELKYLSDAKGTDQAVAAKLEEAKAQLERYRKAPNFRDVRNLDCWAIVFVNAEPKAVEKLP